MMLFLDVVTVILIAVCFVGMCHAQYRMDNPRKPDSESKGGCDKGTSDIVVKV